MIFFLEMTKMKRSGGKIIPTRISYDMTDAEILKYKVVSRLADSIGMIRQRQVWKGDIDNYIDNEKDRDKEKGNDIMKQKVVSSFGRFDWYDQGVARATLLAERKREQGGDFLHRSIRGKSSEQFLAAANTSR